MHFSAIRKRDITKPGWKAKINYGNKIHSKLINIGGRMELALLMMQTLPAAGIHFAHRMRQRLEGGSVPPLTALKFHGSQPHIVKNQELDPVISL